MFLYYLRPNQFFPFFFANFYFFFIWGFNEIYEAFYLLILINYWIDLLLGKGNKFWSPALSYGRVEIFYNIFGIGLTKLKLIELFHDNLIPVSVNSISSSVPNQLQSLRSISIWPLSIILAMNSESLSSSLSHFCNALPRLPYDTRSVIKTSMAASETVYITLMTLSDLQSLIFLRYFGSYKWYPFIVFIVTGKFVYFWVAVNTW